MLRLFLAFCFQILILVGCDASDPVTTTVNTTAANQVQDDEAAARSITLYLEPQPPYSYTPVVDDRIVIAEPVYTVPVTMALGLGTVDETNVKYIGKSCERLLAKYPDLYDCVEEETAEFEYGDVVATVSTDSEGFAAMFLGSAEKYRLRVQSWATEEDSKCYFGGEETIGINETEVSIPLAVFCE